MTRKNKYGEPTPRIESLSDLVFGLALSIGAFSLLSNPPTTPNEMATDMLSFAFSFLILISVWVKYTAIMSVLPMETRATMLLNSMMLFLVSIEPYAFNLVSLVGHFHSSELDEVASLLYALDMGGMMAILGIFAHELAIEERCLVSPKVMSRNRAVRNILFVSGGLFFVSMLPPFWTVTIGATPVRFYFWLLPLVISWIRRPYALPGKPNRTH